MSRRGRPGAGRDAGTFLALLVLIVLAVGLLFLTALVMPQVVGIVIVVFAFFLFGTFHYVVWGWWLSGRSTSDEQEKEESRLL